MAINTTLLFFLLLIPLAGLIALVGDRIGHRMGKKRHSLLGLRPRHTATLFTVCSGMGISFLTIALMYASSETFRDVLARGASLKRENRALENRNVSLDHDMREASENVARLKNEVARAESERTGAERANADARTRRAEAEKRASDAQKTLRRAEASLQAERAKLGATSKDLADARHRVAEARSRLTAASEEKRRAESAVGVAEKRAAEAKNEVLVARAKIAQAGRTFTQVTRFQSERLAAQRKELSTQSARLYRQELRLEEQTRQIEAREADRRAQLQQQRTEVARLTEELKELERRRDDTQQSILTLASTAQALRDGRITYRLGEEIARISLSPGGSVWKVQNNLEALFAAASKKAEARGARASADSTRAVIIPVKTLDSGEQIGEMAAIGEAAKSIRAANQEVVVVAVAAANAIVGEPVASDLKILRNPIVLRAGAPLGTIDLPNTRSREDSAERLFAFLSGDIRTALLDAGVIPPILGNGETSIVTLTGNEWLTLLESTRQFGSRAKIVVRAANDLRAADTVQLQFEVKPLPPPPAAPDRRP